MWKRRSEVALFGPPLDRTWEPTAEEQEEGQERVDQDGELTLPADENLGDLDDVEVSEEEEAVEEADAEVGPLGEPDLVDLELED